MSSNPPPGWRTVCIEEVAEVIGGGTPSTRVAKYFGGDIPWITPKDLSGHEEREIEFGERSLSSEGLAASPARLLPEKAILLSTRAPVGRVAIAAKPVATSQGFRSLILKPGYVPEFFYYLLKGHTGTLESRAGGTTFRELSGGSLKRVEFSVPPAKEQELIGRVLGAFDDKLAGNRRLVSLVEELLKTRFMTVFGSSPGGTEDLSEVQAQRNGWDTVCIGDLLDLAGGSTPSTVIDEYWVGGGHRWATPRDLSGLDSPVLLETGRHLTDAGLAKAGSGLLPAGTVLMSSRAPIGYTAVAGIEMAINQGFIAILPSKRLPGSYVLCWLRENIDRVKSYAGGTTFAEIGKQAFRRIRIPLPPPESLAEFDRFAAPLLSLVVEREVESRALRRIRDFLLPHLISGRIQVSRGLLPPSEASSTGARRER